MWTKTRDINDIESREVGLQTKFLLGSFAGG